MKSDYFEGTLRLLTTKMSLKDRWWRVVSYCMESPECRRINYDSDLQVRLFKGDIGIIYRTATECDECLILGCNLKQPLDFIIRVKWPQFNKYYRIRVPLSERDELLPSFDGDICSTTEFMRQFKLTKLKNMRVDVNPIINVLLILMCIRRGFKNGQLEKPLWCPPHLYDSLIKRFGQFDLITRVESMMMQPKLWQDMATGVLTPSLKRSDNTHTCDRRKDGYESGSVDVCDDFNDSIKFYEVPHDFEGQRLVEFSDSSSAADSDDEIEIEVCSNQAEKNGRGGADNVAPRSRAPPLKRICLEREEEGEDSIDIIN